MAVGISFCHAHPGYAPAQVYKTFMCATLVTAVYAQPGIYKYIFFTRCAAVIFLHAEKFPAIDDGILVDGAEC